MSTPNRKSKRRRLFALYSQQTATGPKAACCFCGRLLEMSALTLEHVIPKSKGGKHDMGNLFLSCARCNRERGAEEFGVFRAKMMGARVERGNG